MSTKSKLWTERELELIAWLRPVADTDEIQAVFDKLGYDRSRESISRQGRRLGIKQAGYSEPQGELTEAETKIVDEVFAKNETRQWAVKYNDVEKYYKHARTASRDEFVDEDQFDHHHPEMAVVSAPIELPDNIKFVDGQALILNPHKITRFIMLNDVHVPHNIPLDAIFDFIRDFKPDHMLLVGDIINNDPFSHWEKKKPGTAKKMPLPIKYFENANANFYRPLREVAGNQCLFTHWEGNHEYWSRKAIEEMPEGEGYWEVWNNIECIDQWVSSKMFARLGRLYFTHGDVIRGGMYHAKKLLSYFNRNLRYGHYHDSSSWSDTSPIDIKDRHNAKCCGTLEKFNPHFMDNRPHDWQHMFTYGYVRPDGTFNDYRVNIVDNKFILHNKEWVGGKND